METPRERYIREHSSPMPEGLDWIVRQTNVRTNQAHMLCGPVQGRFLTMAVQLTGARKVLEIGAFSGYSAACMALGLPPGGHIDSIEVNDEMEGLIREGWRRAGVDGLVTLHIADAKEALQRLTGPYDLIFMDANKREYCDYYEAALSLLRPGGLLMADDVLWDGKAYAQPLPVDAQTRGIVRFNDMVASDPRVECVMIGIRDGLTLIRKL